ncbi:MAG: hypothetical protein WBL95_14320 [Microcoleus sp.]
MVLSFDSGQIFKLVLTILTLYDINSDFHDRLSTYTNFVYSLVTAIALWPTIHYIFVTQLYVIYIGNC